METVKMAESAENLKTACQLLKPNKYLQQLVVGETLRSLTPTRIKEIYKKLTESEISTNEEIDIFREKMIEFSKANLVAREECQQELKEKQKLAKVSGAPSETTGKLLEQSLTSITELTTTRQKLKEDIDKDKKKRITARIDNFPRKKQQVEQDLMLAERKLENLRESPGTNDKKIVSLERKIKKHNKNLTKLETQKQKIIVAAEKLGVENPETKLDKKVVLAPVSDEHEKRLVEIHNLKQTSKTESDRLISDKVKSLRRDHPTASEETLKKMAKKKTSANRNMLKSRTELKILETQIEGGQAPPNVAEKIETHKKAITSVLHEQRSELESNLETETNPKKKKIIKEQIAVRSEEIEHATQKAAELANSAEQVASVEKEASSGGLSGLSGKNLIYVVIIIIITLGIALLIIGSFWALIVFFRTRRRLVPEEIRKGQSKSSLILKGLGVFLLSYSYIIYHQIKYGFMSVF